LNFFINSFVPVVISFQQLFSAETNAILDRREQNGEGAA